MLHHAFDKVVGLPYFSYGPHGARFHYHEGNERAMHSARTKALKLAHDIAVRGSALIGGEGARPRRRRAPRRHPAAPRRHPAAPRHRVARMYV